MGGSFNVSRSRNRSRPYDYTPSEFVNLRDEVSETIDMILRTGGGPRYPGPFVAPITEAELENLSWLQDLQAPTRAQDLGEDLRERTLAGDFLDPESNPFLRDYVRAAQEDVRESYDEGEMARRALFARAGHSLPSSSPFAHAQVKGQDEYGEAISDIATQVYAGAYAAERELQTVAMDQERQAVAQRWIIAIQNLEAQALPRLIAQMGIDRAIEEHYRRQELLMAALGVGGQLTEPTLGYVTKGDSISWGTSGSSGYTWS